MPSRWNAWTHLQNVQFDYGKTPKMRQMILGIPNNRHLFAAFSAARAALRICRKP